MMAGAKGERGLDLDADIVGAQFCAIMRAVNQKSPDAHRLETGEALRNPVRRRDRLDDQRPRRVLVCRERDQTAQACLIGRLAKMDGDLPAAGGVVLEGRAGCILAAEAFRTNMQPFV